MRRRQTHTYIFSNRNTLTTSILTERTNFSLVDIMGLPLHLFRFHQLTLRGFPALPTACSAAYTVPSMPDTRSKSAKIQSSIKLYLKRIQNYESMIETEREDFERGRKYLAQIMGEDPSTFNQEKIDQSIAYLFPSGLFSLKARPKLKPPEEIFPKEKELQCDSAGRPLHSLFYTRYPHFYSVMNEAAYQLEALKEDWDTIYINKSQNPLKNRKDLVLVTTEWFTKAQLEEAIGESVLDEQVGSSVCSLHDFIFQYDQWLVLMNRIVSHPLAYSAEKFIFQYRARQIQVVDAEKYPDPELDPVTQQKFITSYGQKRRCFAEVCVRSPGTGVVDIDGKNLLEAFPLMGNREQIMFPLHVTGTLGKVDIKAKLSGEGTSSPANAVRLAISRCLASLLPDQQGRQRLLVSGLLTQDDRFAERKKPGQKKARKKPIWKAR
ncbi:Mitochondrial ribosomal protein S9 [Fasciola hepatica]|uniref:Mitochondrial ribosomal protein S9 n=1 Tax=Fasciola hepatica TaxID=6192 RepID=A0A4E0RSU5_FASHE|nr:Mitochondrial ribosomal protein S9 [Fasciola hepatica]